MFRPPWGCAPVIEVQLDAASVARIRVCASPAFEVVEWLGLAALGTRHPVLGDPGPSARFALRDRDVATTAAIVASTARRRYVPDYLVPKPMLLADHRLFGDQLEKIRATSSAQVHVDIGDSPWPRAVPGLTAVPEEALPAVTASGLSKFWKGVLADGWSHLQQALAAQVRLRGELLGRHGVGALVNSVHRHVSWTGTGIIVDKVGNQNVRFSNKELVLVPSALTLPQVTVQVSDPEDAFITFPVAAARPRPVTRRSRASLLGRGRSVVLTSLRLPATTRELAGLVRLSEATVSHHLHTLADAGLVEGSRHGRRVLYRLTDPGQALVDAIDPSR
jgi:DNA-binding transcriptional ArsR family regulator